MAMRGGGNAPNRSGSQSVCIRHSELAGPIYGSVGYQTYYNELISPTNTNLWPWLSQLAVMYEIFEIRSMRFRFETNCGPATTVQQQGQVGMVVVYDADDAAPSDWATLCNTDGARSAVTYKNLTLNFKTGNSLFRSLFVNHGGPTDLSSPGRIVVGVTGQQTTGVLMGQLWIDYDVCVRIPRANPITLSAFRWQDGHGNKTDWHTLCLSPPSGPLSMSGWPLVPGPTPANGPSGGHYTWTLPFLRSGLYQVDIQFQSANSLVTTQHAGTVSASYTGNMTYAPGWTTGYNFVKTGGSQLNNIVAWNLSVLVRCTEPTTDWISLDFTDVAASVEPAMVVYSIVVKACSTFTTGTWVPVIGAKKSSSTEVVERNLTQEVAAIQAKLALLTGKDEVPTETTTTKRPTVEDEVESPYVETDDVPMSTEERSALNRALAKGGFMSSSSTDAASRGKR